MVSSCVSPIGRTRYTTAMTVLDNLHQKGWVRREAEGRAYRYEAVSTRAAHAAALMNDAWSHSDNPVAALVAFFGMMSEEQRQALHVAVRIVQGPGPGETTAARADSVGEAAVDTTGEAAADTSAETGAESSDETAAPSKDPDENPASAQGGTGR
ncbi:BlaI/MecI/CopY family transcriptional regulator [Streptomyces acidicola]|uniref:BlaI/MecI/CopY family transcriptional regulator n=1 Tax=Streptomyces acidicola TaxID=2596892 RepID=UPI0037909561